MKAFFALAVVLADNQAPKVSALHRTASAELLLDGAEGEVANARENLAPEFSDLRLNDGILRSFLEATSKKEAPALGSEKVNLSAKGRRNEWSRYMRKCKQPHSICEAPPPFQCTRLRLLRGEKKTAAVGRMRPYASKTIVQIKKTLFKR
eukprot:GEMP01086545.1.p2 GENE.GEMP01086545.1~~GEMP01086545.1.p2  ORF type:complete len:150 (+),score=18.35 GEMP01086545.1:296-745(+)